MQQHRVGQVRLLMLFGHFSIFFLFITSLNASTFENFKRQQEDSFAKYSSKADKEFKKYLDRQWIGFELFDAKHIYKERKPKYILSRNPKEIIDVGPKVDINLDKNLLKEQEIPIKLLKSKDYEFDFFGLSVGFNVDDKIKKAKFYPRNQYGVSKFFETLASSDYTYIVSSIKKIGTDYQLNDWAIYLLVTKLSNKIFKNRDEADIFSWFIFNKLGLDVRLGIAKKHIVLSFYTKQNIYEMPSYKFNSRRYYVLSQYSKDNAKNLYSYEHEYPNKVRAFDFSLPKLPKFPKDILSKELKFHRFSKDYIFKIKYNQNLIDFLATYPQVDFEVYFNAPLEPITYKTLMQSFKNYIDATRASRAINFVLNFVQNSFIYETDYKQFSKEKIMFAQETLYYDRSDCEDRSILFAYLIRKLFHIGVVGVKYSNHLATALYIPIDGDSINVGRRRFVIADPTYINANIGQSMPKYRGVKPDAIYMVK